MAKPNFILPNKPAIKAGSILSYNYTDDLKFAAEPLDFSRNSSATRVNEQGLIEEVGYFGPQLIQNGDFSQEGSELVTNGDFATDSDWIKETGWSIGSGVASYNGSSANNGLYENLSLATGTIYRLSFSIVNYVSGTLVGALSSGSISGNTPNITADGDYVFNLTATGALCIFRSISSFNGSIDNVSVKEVGQDWNLGTGWSIGDSEAIATSGSGTANKLTQTNTLNGKYAKVSLDVSNYGGSGLILVDFGSTTSSSITSNGTHILYGTYDQNDFQIYKTDDFSANIDNISVIEIIGDKPRIDYSDSSTEPSLLLEPQSTNLFTYSNDFSGYIKSEINIVSNIATSPDGTVNATSLTNTSTGQAHIRTSFVAASTGNYTGTSYIKKQDFDFIYVEFGNAFCWFNISNGTLGNSGNFGSGWTFISHSIESVGNDWYRISITANNTITGTYNFRPYQPTSANASYTSGSLGNSFIWGVQVEQNSYATSYIPTSGSTATRLGETANNAGGAGVFNSEEGVLYAEIKRAEGNATSAAISLNNGTSSNGVSMYFFGVNNFYVDIFSSSGTVTIAGGVVSISDYIKVAVKYKNGDSAIWINGIEVATNSAAVSLVGLNQLLFGYTNGGLPFYGKTKNIQVFNYALTDEELQTLTT